ncbi:hypothetical protein SEA_CEN1621_59 [Microbacterium phage Cen1621]|uniref:Uncharacterized protein n=1 Tax=Microbacterium phage Cen1621 TaxID=2965191 RepID=A0A9E7QAQ5_9CAUD|nr:hypothetical protein SEA_CEN1621_59 [Microbacterium phage Cen1621]
MSTLSVPIALPVVDPQADRIIEPTTPLVQHYSPIPASEWEALLWGDGHEPLVSPRTRRQRGRHVARRAPLLGRVLLGVAGTVNAALAPDRWTRRLRWAYARRAWRGAL